jgi:soluble lytic murein transglycosylase-like protein
MVVIGGLGMAFAPDDAPSVVAPDSPSPLPLRLTLDGPDALSPDVADKAITGGGVAQWAGYIDEASERFGVPKTWIRAVMTRESGGRTCDDALVPLKSKAGAMGLMQVMPGTYADLRKQYDLGADPYNPHDNIIAGTAYLKYLKGRYGYPALFAAYNHGPANFDEHLRTGRALPRETRNYLAAVTKGLRGTDSAKRGHHRRASEPSLRLASI